MWVFYIIGIVAIGAIVIAVYDIRECVKEMESLRVVRVELTGNEEPKITWRNALRDPVIEGEDEEPEDFYSEEWRRIRSR